MIVPDLHKAGHERKRRQAQPPRRRDRAGRLIEMVDRDGPQTLDRLEPLGITALDAAVAAVRLARKGRRMFFGHYLVVVEGDE